jgi:hypothetical protein
MFCHVPEKNVLAVHDCPSVYHVPLLLRKQVDISLSLSLSFFSLLFFLSLAFRLVAYIGFVLTIHYDCNILGNARCSYFASSTDSQNRLSLISPSVQMDALVRVSFLFILATLAQLFLFFCLFFACQDRTTGEIT